MQDFVTFVMPVYNAAAFVGEAVESVCAQTWREWEMVAVDDGSTDGSGDLLDEWARRDGRVRVLHQENRGAVAALNRGLDLAAARGEDGFVAIMHADDVCLPARLERQVGYLAAHPEIDLCGTWMRTFGAEERTWRYPSDPRFTKAFLLFWCCFSHPTMMWRRRVVADGLRYDAAMPMPCEDYALWARASRRYQMGNVPEVLLRYRAHAGQGGVVNREKTAALTKGIRREQLEWLGVMPTAEEMAIHQRLAESELGEDGGFVAAARAWLEKLWAANAATRRYDAEALEKVLGGRWAATCVHAAARGRLVWRIFWDCPLAAFVDRTLEKNRGIPDRAGS